MSGTLTPVELEKQMREQIDAVVLAARALTDLSKDGNIPSKVELSAAQAKLRSEIRKLSENVKSNKDNTDISESVKAEADFVLTHGRELANPTPADKLPPLDPKSVLGQLVEAIQKDPEAVAKDVPQPVHEEAAKQGMKVTDVLKTMASVISNPVVLNTAKAVAAFIPGVGPGIVQAINLAQASGALPIVGKAAPLAIDAAAGLTASGMTFPKAVGLLTQTAVAATPIITMLVPGAQVAAPIVGVIAPMVAPIAGKIAEAVATKVEEAVKAGVAQVESVIGVVPAEQSSVMAKSLRGHINEFSHQGGRSMRERVSRKASDKPDRDSNRNHAEGPELRAELFVKKLVKLTGSTLNDTDMQALRTSAQDAFTKVEAAGKKSFGAREQLHLVLGEMSKDDKLPADVKDGIIKPLATQADKDHNRAQAVIETRAASREKYLAAQEKSGRVMRTARFLRHNAPRMHGRSGGDLLAEARTLLTLTRRINYVMTDDEVRNVNLKSYGRIRIRFIKPEKVALFTGDQIRNAGPKKVSQFTPKQIAALSHDGDNPGVDGLTAQHLNALRGRQLRALSGPQVNRILEKNPDAINGMRIPLRGRAQISYLDPAALAKITPENFSKIDARQVKCLRAHQLNELTKDQWQKGMQRAQLRSIKPSTISKLSAESITNMGKNIVNLKGGRFNNQIKALGAKQIKGITPDQMKLLRPNQIKYLSGKQLDCFDAKQLAALDEKQIKAISPKAIAKMKDTTIEKLGDKVQYFTKEQMRALKAKHLNKMSEDQFKILSKEQIRNISPKELGKMDPQKIQNLGENIKYLSTKQIKALKAKHLNEMTPDQFKSLSKKQIRNISPKELAKMDPQKIQNLGENIIYLTTKQIKALKAEHFENMNTEKIDALSPKQIRAISKKAILAMVKNGTIDKFANKILEFSPKQIGYLDANYLNRHVGIVTRFTDKQLRGISRAALRNISPDVIRQLGDRVAQFKPKQIGALNLEAVGSISADAFVKMSASQIKKLTPKQCNQISDAQLSRLQAIVDSNLPYKQRMAAARKLQVIYNGQAKEANRLIRKEERRIQFAEGRAALRQIRKGIWKGDGEAIKEGFKNYFMRTTLQRVTARRVGVWGIERQERLHLRAERDRKWKEFKAAFRSSDNAIKYIRSSIATALSRSRSTTVVPAYAASSPADTPAKPSKDDKYTAAVRAVFPEATPKSIEAVVRRLLRVAGVNDKDLSQAKLADLLLKNKVGEKDINWKKLRVDVKQAIVENKKAMRGQESERKVATASAAPKEVTDKDVRKMEKGAKAAADVAQAYQKGGKLGAAVAVVQNIRPLMGAASTLYKQRDILTSEATPRTKLTPEQQKYYDALQHKDVFDGKLSPVTAMMMARAALAYCEKNDIKLSPTEIVQAFAKKFKAPKDDGAVVKPSAYRRPVPGSPGPCEGALKEFSDNKELVAKYKLTPEEQSKVQQVKEQVQEKYGKSVKLETICKVMKEKGNAGKDVAELAEAVNSKQKASFADRVRLTVIPSEHFFAKESTREFSEDFLQKFAKSNDEPGALQSKAKAATDAAIRKVSASEDISKDPVYTAVQEHVKQALQDISGKSAVEQAKIAVEAATKKIAEVAAASQAAQRVRAAAMRPSISP